MTSLSLSWNGNQNGDKPVAEGPGDHFLGQDDSGGQLDFPLYVPNYSSYDAVCRHNGVRGWATTAFLIKDAGQGIRLDVP